MNDDPHDLADSGVARDSPYADMLRERNAFYGSLSIAAKDAFLRTLERAAREGLSHEEAWKEAVIAAETTYTADGQVRDPAAEGPLLDPRMDALKDDGR